MEYSDFDPKFLELAEEYANAIYGGVASSLDIASPLDYKDTVEWIKAQLVFFAIDAEKFIK